MGERGQLEEDEAVVLLDVENELREVHAAACVEPRGDLRPHDAFGDARVAGRSGIGGRQRRRGSGDAELDGAARPAAVRRLERSLDLVVGGLVVDLLESGAQRYGVVDQVDRELAVF